MANTNHRLPGMIAIGMLALLLLCLPPARADAPRNTPMDQDPWGQILSRYVIATPDGLNLFAYGRVTPADRARLRQYLATLEASTPSRMPREAQMAFWINLYNAKTIDVVLDHYPVKSIRDISLGGLFTIGPWKQKNMIVEGRNLSLDDVEHAILRKQWQDPRVHYALNCASIGCPNLANRPFAAERLEIMLDEGARNFVNHPRGARLEAGRLTLSRIYQWYRDDFGRSDAEVIRHIAGHASPALKQALSGIREIDGYDYNWNLNEAK